MNIECRLLRHCGEGRSPFHVFFQGSVSIRCWFRYQQSRIGLSKQTRSGNMATFNPSILFCRISISFQSQSSVMSLESPCWRWTPDAITALSHPPSSALNPHSSLSQLLSVEVMALPCPWLKSGSKLFPFLTEDPEKAVEYYYFPLYSKITIPGGDLSGNWVVIWAPICGEAGWGGFHCSFRTPQGEEYASMPYYHTFFLYQTARR